MNRYGYVAPRFKTERQYAKIDYEDRLQNPIFEEREPKTEGEIQTEKSQVEEAKKADKEHPLRIEKQILNKFGELKGFDLLIKMIMPTNPSDKMHIEGANSDMMHVEGTTDTKEAQDSQKISVYLLEKISYFIFRISDDLDSTFLEGFIPDVVAAFCARIDAITSKEIKDIDLDVVKNCLANLERSFKDHPVGMYIPTTVQEKELDLYLKALECPNFEKKLKALGGIKDFCNRMEKQDRMSISSDFLVDWILKNTIIDDIYLKYNNPELMKRSLDILKFLACASKTFPEPIIDLIWDSSREKHEEIVRTINENILELVKCLKPEEIDVVLRKVLATLPQDIDAEILKFLCDFTEIGLERVLYTDELGCLKVKSAGGSIQYPALTIPLLFSYLNDESSANSEMTDKILSSFRKMAKKYPCPDLWHPYLLKSLDDLKAQQNIMQSYNIIHILLSSLDKIENEAYTHALFSELREKYSIIQRIVDEMCSFHNKTRDALSAYKEQHIVEENGISFLDSVVRIGKYSLRENLKKRKKMLIFLLEQSKINVNLNEEQLDSLWRIYVLEPNLPYETKKFFKFLTHSGPCYEKPVLTNQLISYCFKKIICDSHKFDSSFFTKEKFRCMKRYFILFNAFQKNIDIDITPQDDTNYEDFIVVNDNLENLQTLWDYYYNYNCTNHLILEEYTELLVNCYLRVEGVSAEKQQENFQNLIRSCVETILSSAKERKEVPIKRTFFFLKNLFNTFDEKPRYIASMRNPRVMIDVLYCPCDQLIQMEFGENQTIAMIKESIAEKFSLDSGEFDILVNDEVIDSKRMSLELQKFEKKNSMSLRSKVRTEQEIAANPKYILANNFEFMEKILISLSEIYTGAFFLIATMRILICYLIT